MFGLFPAVQEEDINCVEVRTSTIQNAGQGVFATNYITKNTKIGRYQGLGMTKSMIDSIYGTGIATYALSVTCTNASDCGTYEPHKDHIVCIDGLFGGNWTTYINDGPHSGIAENVYFAENGTIITLTDIKKGEELFVSYGEEYWDTA